MYVKIDWLKSFCPPLHPTHYPVCQCNALNFARRDRCFGCGATGGSGGNNFCSVVPTKVLRISGLRRGGTADEVRDGMAWHGIAIYNSRVYFYGEGNRRKGHNWMDLYYSTSFPHPNV